MVINVQLSHSHNSSFPLGFNKGKGANTGMQLLKPHQYDKEVLKSHISVMLSVTFIQPIQISIITGLGFFWFILVFSFVIKINSQDTSWNSSPLLNYVCFVHCFYLSHS